MARKEVVIQSKKSPMSELMRELPGLLAQYANAKQEREFKGEQLEAEYKYRMKELEYANQLKEKELNLKRLDAIDQSLSDKGLVINALDSLNSSDSTGAAFLLDPSKDSLLDDREAEASKTPSIDQKIRIKQNILSSHNAGKQAYNQALLGGYDANADNLLQIEEINSFIDDEKGNLGLNTEASLNAFRTGMKSSIPTGEQYQKYLGEIADTEKKITDAATAKAKQVKEMKGFDDFRSLAEYEKGQAMRASSFSALEHEKAKVLLNTSEFQYNTQVQGEVAKRFDEAITSAIGTDNRFGKTMLLSITPYVQETSKYDPSAATMVLEDKKMHPLVSLLAMEPEDKEKVMKKIKESHPYVFEDIVEFNAALTLGNVLTEIPDYSMFNEKLMNIYGEYSTFKLAQVDIDPTDNVNNAPIHDFLDNSFFEYSQRFGGTYSQLVLVRL